MCAVTGLMQRKRIATLIWKDGFGGAERSICDLAAALDKNRFDMWFYYLSGGPVFFAQEIKEMGFQTIFLNWKNGFDAAGRIRLLKHLKEFNPHVIHDHILPPFTRPLLKIFIRRPILNTEHGSALQRWLGFGEKWRKLAERFDYLFCDYIAANSAASANALKGAYRLSDSKVGIIHLGINLQQFRPIFPKQRADDVLIVGYVGRIKSDLKGTDYLPLVAKELIDLYNLRFQIFVAGDGPDRKQVEQSCIELGVEKYITFLGWVSDVSNFLSKIDVLLVPSRFEAFGLTAIEALAMNVPVVAFDIHGLREILAGCPAGIMVSPGDTRKMAEAVYSLRSNYLNVGSKGRDFVARRFSNDQMARQYEKIYASYARSFYKSDVGGQ